MLLLVGLGNPGDKYRNTRHNAGFIAVDRIADHYHFSSPRSRFQGEVREGVIDGEKCLALKPMTFMNHSGQSVGEAMRFYKIGPEDVMVVYDDLDLTPLKIKPKAGGGHGGHNGLRDIHSHIGPYYRRLRIGIGHPGHKDLVTPYVLSNFPKAELEALPEVCDAVAKEFPWLIKGDDARFSTALALHMKKDTPKSKE